MLTVAHVRKVFIGLIIAISLFPMLSHMFMTSRGSDLSNENRNLNQLPEMELLVQSPTQFTSKFSDYLNDNFGGRSIFIRSYNRVKNKIDQGNSQMVRGIGESWLFYNFPKNWDQYSARQGPSSQAIIQGNKTLSEFRASASELGIVFLSTYIPNKNRIYPEYVPPRYGSISASSYVEQYDWDLSIVETLKDGKSQSPMYLQTDTHWTNLAAFQTYELLMRELSQQGLKLPVLSRSQLQPRNMSSFEGDLIKLGGLNPALYPEPHSDILAPPTDPNKVVASSLSASGNPQFKTIIHEYSDSNETTLVIIGDSFAKLLIPFFNHSFDRVIFMHNELGGFDFDAALRYQPDAMIFAPVERFAEQISTYPNPLY